MAPRKRTPILSLRITPVEVDPEVTRLAGALAARIAALEGVPAQAAALNAARIALHAVSPWQAEPVDCVLWVPAESVRGNPYNPNAVAPPEMELLRRSVHSDGYTQPVVTWAGADGREIVDGFHRSKVGAEKGAIRTRCHGHLPVTTLAAARTAQNDRIASTIRHNRARGVHGVDPMSDVVRLCIEAGWRDEDVQRELGMELDEVVRLKQITGLAALFAGRDFSEAWEAVDPDAGEDAVAP